MHDVKALIAKSGVLQSKAGQFSNAVVCPLSQGYSLLPITDAFAKELSAYRSASSASRATPLEEISPELLILATEISQLAPVAYITTGYFGGQGGQDAVVWDKGNLVFSPSVQGYDRVWPDSPISQALRSIGVVAEEEKDEFDTVGLGNHRETHRWAESVA